MAVARPVKLILTNYPEGEVEMLDAPLYPHDVPLTGSRPVPFSRELWIERDDFLEDPPKKFFRLAPGREVRLRYGYLVTCTGVVKDAGSEIVEIHATYDPATRGGDAPDKRRVQGTIHWVSAAHALDCELRLYDRLFAVADPDALPEGQDFVSALNPNSLVVAARAKVEPGVGNDDPGTRYQFERTGYFISDPVESGPGRLIFNRTVALRDSWAKVSSRPPGALA
jgi:glutaminyl-tRNA synthetase